MINSDPRGNNERGSSFVDDCVALVTAPFLCFVLRGTNVAVVMVSFSVGVNFSPSLGTAFSTAPFPTSESLFRPNVPPFTAGFVLFGGGNTENKPPPRSGRGLFFPGAPSSFGALTGFGRSTRICFFVGFGRVACWRLCGAGGGEGALSSESLLLESDE